MDLFVDFLVTKHGLAGALQNNAADDPLYDARLLAQLRVAGALAD